MEQEWSPIQRWYLGRSVLVTGGTGFMGKVLVEKLLRSTRVAVVYLLMRPKKGKSVEQRRNDLFQDPIFSRLQESDVSGRVVVIEGDSRAPGLGLTPENDILLKSRVQVIFHGAATVRFDESLTEAITTNVRGTRHVVQLATACPKLEAFVHISTAYANCTKYELEEKFFDPPMTGDNAIKLTECLDEKQLTTIADGLCGEYPNTYAFSKAIAENIVKVHGKGLPVVVFRPSIVVATANEPLPGWIDNIYGPTGVMCGAGAGVLRAFEVNESYVADMVPVDFAVNAIIASAWDIKDSKEPRVYNYVSSCQNPLTWRWFMEIGLRYGRENPSTKAIWWCTMTTTRIHLVFLLYHLVLHLIPALFVDAALIVTGHKPMLWPVYKKVYKFTKVVTYFSKRQWKFHNDQVLCLWNSLDPRDRQVFNFDISSLDWNNYFKDCVEGLRCNFFKDEPASKPAARRKQFWFYLAHQLLKSLLIASFGWVSWKTFPLVLSA